MLGSFSTRPLHFCYTATDNKPVFKIMHKFLFKIKSAMYMNSDFNENYDSNKKWHES